MNKKGGLLAYAFWIILGFFIGVFVTFTLFCK